MNVIVTVSGDSKTNISRNSLESYGKESDVNVSKHSQFQSTSRARPEADGSNFQSTISSRIQNLSYLDDALRASQRRDV